MKKISILLLGILIGGGVAMAAPGAIGQGLLFKDILPTVAGVSTAPEKQPTEEQQGVAAVRQAKAAVVNIVGILPGRSGEPAEARIGTGFIVGSDGYIVTNHHIIRDVTGELNVIFVDGSRSVATVVGSDAFTDTALLKINAAGLTTLPFGNSDQLETGQTVFAIGNSYGEFQNTVTRGVISGLGRILSPKEEGRRLQNLIQTDAAIYSGNSGGPLINLKGEVIGMNTLKDSSGFGFSVPINTVSTIINQLKNGASVKYGYLGVSFGTIDRLVQASYGLKQSEGALITKVASGSPAASAGIREGDIVLVVNKQVLSSQIQLDSVLAKLKPGELVTLTLYRDGQTFEVSVVLGEAK